MKSLTQILLLGTFLFTTSVFAQTLVWNTLPATPLNPNTGETSPQSSDVSIGDDGRMYATYIFNNGSNYQIHFDEYTVGTGWTSIYTDFVYSGFEAIHSYKHNGDVYVMVKRDDAVATEKMRLYQISAGSVSLVTDFDFSNIPNGADFRSVLSEDGNYIYMLHNSTTGTNLNISQLNILGGTVTTLQVPTGSSTAYNYDLVEHQDTVYIGLTRDEIPVEFRTYLHKVDNTMAAVVPHHPGNVTGQMGAVGPSSTLVGLSMGKDQLNHIIHIITRENNAPFTYQFIPATLTTTLGGSLINFAPRENTPVATVNLNQRTIRYGVVNPYNPVGDIATIFEHRYTDDQQTTLYNTAVSAPNLHVSNFRLGFTEDEKGIASHYDTTFAVTHFYYSNHIPFVQSNGTEHTACAQTNSLLYSGVKIVDIDGTTSAIQLLTGTDGSIFPNGTLTATQTGQSGDTTIFDIYGTAVMGGVTSIIVSYTDQINPNTFILPVTVLGTVPTFNQTTISICSNNGLVNLSDYVSQSGGTFTISGSSAPFNGMFFNSNFSGLTYETSMPIDYSMISAGCTVHATTQFILHESAVVTVAATATTCGGNTGSAIATISGGMMPFTLQAWSSGETSVTSVNNLSQGTYTFTVQGANACTTIQEFTIVPTGVDIVPTIVNASCYGANNGSISTSLTGFTAPTAMIWSSGYSVSSINNLVPGTYTLTVTDALNCVYTEAFTITQPTQLSASTAVVSPTCGNTDGSAEVQNIAGGISPYGVAWSSGGTNALEPNVGYGVYSATITDFTGCQTIKTVFVSELNSANLVGTITGSQCGSNTGGIDVTPYLANANATVQAISWSSGETTEDISAIPAALYVCTLTTDANCHAVKGWNVPIVSPQMQPICVITVDSTTSTNLVVWEEVQPIGIHHYNIYRETSSQGEYILIDTVEATNISLFNDVIASPIARSWSYKISAVNGCNVEGPLSPQHRTMHLSAIQNGTQTDVSWNAYEGTAYSSFVLWRYTFADGWMEIGTLPTTQVIFTDNIDFATPGLDYMVELDLDQQCTALVYRSQDFNTTRSNKDKGAFSVGDGTGDSNNGIEEWLLDQVKLYPNPTNGILSIEQSTNNTLTIVVSDLTGKKLMETTQSALESTIDLSELVSGIYLVQYRINNQNRTQHIVKL